MHKLESIQENEMNKIPWDFEIQMNLLISVRRSNLVMINKKRKKTSCIMDFAIQTDHRVKTKKAKKR